MVTPHNPSRGIDLYVDASGEDDWDLPGETFYLHGLMLCGPSRKWIEWMRIHQTRYEGMIHWSDGRFGKQKRKLDGVKAQCRELLATHPWFRASIYVINRKEFSESYFSKHGRRIKKCEVSRAIWKNMGASFLNTVIPHLKSIVPDDQLGCLSVRQVVINNPKRGSRQEIQRTFQKMVDRTPEFVSAGHPGIDALDGVLWAFHRCLNLGKPDCLPDPVGSFNKDLGVFLLGLVSDNLVKLDSMAAIEDFRRVSLI